MTLFKLPRSLFRALACATLVGLGSVAPAVAQGLFSPAIQVNDRFISYYEIKQRTLLLSLIQPLNSSEKTAREQLVNERLQLEAAEILGLQLTQEGIDAGVDEFAGRANMTGQEFLEALASEGVDATSVKDFVRAGITWRHVVRTRFGGRVQITEAAIDRALAANSGGLRVLMSEIIIPMQPQTEEQVMEVANNISQITSVTRFAQAAREYSAAPTRDQGGRINWMPISNLPPAIQPLVFGLKPGEVTDPIPLPNGQAVALFQLRGIEESDVPKQTFAAIDYATYQIPGGRTPEGLAQAKSVMNLVDTCDDLYGIAKGKPEATLQREAMAPGDIPQDIALELAKLDRHEFSTNVTRNNGQTLLLVMLCSRTAEANEDVSRDQVSAALRGQRLQAFAESYLAQLKADAIIVEK